MSLVFHSIQRPSKIDDAIFTSSGVLVMSRGDELVFSPGPHSRPKIFPLFSEIANVANIKNNIAVFLQSETILVFSAKGKLLQSADFSSKIGKIVPKSIAASNGKFVISHNRLRTLTLFTIDSSDDTIQSFKHVLVPFDKIFSIVATNDAFYILGINIHSKIVVSRFTDFIENTVELNIDDKIAALCSFKNHVYVGAGPSIYLLEDNDISKIDKESGCAQITSMAIIKDKKFICADASGSIYINGIKKLLLSPTSKFVISNNLIIQLSEHGDSHILAYTGELKVINSFAQMVDCKSITRSSFITSDGKIRSFLNGNTTTKTAEISLKGANKCFVSDGRITVSTYDETHFFNFDTFEEISDLNNDVTIFAADGIRVTKFQLITPAKTITYTDEICHSAFFSNFLLLAFSTNHISLINIDTFETIDERDFDDEISSIALSDGEFSVSFWQNSNIYKSVNNSIETVDLDMVTSLIYYCGELVVGGVGEVYWSGEKINIGIGATNLKIFNNKLFVISDSLCYFDEEKRVFYIDTPRPLYDAVPLSDGCLCVTDSGVVQLFFEDRHHSHVEEHFLYGYSILTVAVDEFNNCPTVFGATKDGISYLLSTISRPVVIHNAKPTCLLWVRFDDGPRLIVGGAITATQGILIVYNSSLEKIADFPLPQPPSGLTFVDKQWVAVAYGTQLAVFQVTPLSLMATVATRSGCASITSPNSSFIVYADKYSSVVLYCFVEGSEQCAIEEVARDYHPKQLVFASAVSEDRIVAVGKDGQAYLLAIKGKVLETIAAYKAGASIVAGFSAPPITFVTGSGALMGIFKGSQDLIKVYGSITGKTMGGQSPLRARRVGRPGNEYPTGMFVDGDLLEMVLKMNDAEVDEIARVYGNGKTRQDIISMIKEEMEMVNQFRQKHQQLPPV